MTSNLAHALQSYDNQTALGMASRQGHVETVCVLLAAGADINAKNKVRTNRIRFPKGQVRACSAPEQMCMTRTTFLQRE